MRTPVFAKTNRTCGAPVPKQFAPLIRSPARTPEQGPIAFRSPLTLPGNWSPLLSTRT